MTTHIRPILLLMCFLLDNFGVIIANNKHTDRDALVSFKSQVTDPKNALSGWVTNSNHCTWYGVNCSKVGSRVQSLTLTGLGLSGKLPSHLSYLTYLHLLDLSSNNLSGNLPQELGKLQHLHILDLSLNNLIGKIPPSFGNLCNLTHLQLSQNNFSGEFPTSIFNISSLVFLSVTKNNLSGKLPPYLGHVLQNLRNLHLATNRFEGVIPDSISNASQLEYLDFANNQFHGDLPHFNNLKNLTYLILGNNSLYSNTSLNIQFFDSLRDSTKLQVLRIHGNRLAGELPKSFANLSSNLQWLCVGDNALTGSIPRGMDKFRDLMALSLENNYFTGEIPPEIGALNKLQQLWIHNNSLSGEIPDIFGNLTNLYSVAMAENQLSGRIHSSIGQCKRLNYLYLGMNRLGGSIPTEIFELPGLTVLSLKGNALDGSIQPEVSTMKQLLALDVSHNQLSGSIPTEIGGCYTLTTLMMEGNNFDGSIPISLGNLASLETLDLSSNNLSGPIPQSFEKLGSMRTLNLSLNHLEGQVPMKGVFMNFNQVDLQGNKKLCSLNEEAVQKLRLFRCDVLEGKKKRHILLPIILAVIGGTALLISLLSLLWIIMLRKKKNKQGKIALSSAPLKGLPENISYSDIRLATNNFASENLIGKGAFGYVYKVVLTLSSGEATNVAVKVLDLQHSQASQSFKAECEALRNARHRNLVKVITSCSSIDYAGDDFKAIVMQFMVNGNLDMWLYPTDEESGSSLTLLQRLNIAIDVASAMDYLHHDCDPPVVHCDLKPVNVLLDENMVAHVGDFGLARFLSQNPSEKESSTLGLKGSIGYIAPEYGLGSKASTAGDVYSFGILMLEMLVGKKPTDEMFKEGLSLNKFAGNQVLNVVDQRLINYNQSTRNSNNNDSILWSQKAEECIRVGLCCTAQEPKDRWSMREALTKLQGIKHSPLAL